MADFPLPITTELRIDGAWTDISGDVRTADAITVKRGRSDEADTADPSKLSLKLNNRHGDYSPRNPNSPLFGRIHRNTELRMRLGETVGEPDPEMTDTFSRTETGGWGDADTGQTWETAIGSSSDLSVGSGRGSISLPSVDTETGAIIEAPIILADLDLWVRLRIDTAPVGEAYDGVLVGIYARFFDGTGLFFEVEIGTDTGRIDGGLRVSTRIQADDVGVLTPQEVVPDLAASVDGWLWVRIQMDGPEVRMRVWNDGSPEPGVWHSQGYTETRTSAGQIAVTGVIRADDTPTPVVLDVDDLTVQPLAETDAVTRYVGEVAAWPPRWNSTGSEAWVPLKAAGIRRRLSQGRAPLGSALAESLPAHQPLAYWPMEDGPDTTEHAASGIEGVPPLRVRGLTFAETEGPAGSRPLPVATSDFARILSPDIAMRSTGVWEVDMLFFLADDDWPEGIDQELLTVTSSGTAARWRVSIGTDSMSGDRVVVCRAFDDEDGTILDTGTVDIDTSALTFTDAWRQLRLNVREDGSNVFWTMFWVDEDGSGSGMSGTFTGSPGTITRIPTTFGNEISGGQLTIGHLSAWGAPTTRGYFDTVTGLRGETARERMVRVAAQRGVPLRVTGRGDTAMGPQPADATFLEILVQCEEADLGALTEMRDQSGLQYRARSTLYNQAPALVLTYTDGEITPPVEPTDDDQQSRNDVTVEREEGSTARAVDRDGPMGVRTIGRYDTSVPLNLEGDDQLASQAAWRLHLGTIDELRVPTLTLNLRNPRMQAHHDAIMALDTGDRIQILEPPEWPGGTTLDLLVQGYEEQLGLFEWTVTLTCTPASAWDVWRVRPQQEIEESFEDDDLAITITDGGDAAWVRTQDEVVEGEWSLRSGAITDDQSSDAVVTVPSGAVELEFWYKVSCETSFDEFRVLFDGVEQFHGDGEVPWTRHTADVSSVSEVTFRYIKDSSVSEGADAAWIDVVQFTLSAFESDPPQDSRLDTEGSSLALAVDETATELVVATDTPHRVWITTDGRPQDLPLWLKMGGETVRVDDVQGEQSPQTMTVVRSVNGIVKSHPAGTRVRLAGTEDAQ